MMIRTDSDFFVQVLDEADQLLQTDQQKALAEIYQRLPQHGVGDLRLQVRDRAPRTSRGERQSVRVGRNAL